MKNFKKVLSLVLVAVMVIGCMVVMPTRANAAEAIYTEVTDVATINDAGSEGKNFVIIAPVYDDTTQTYTYYAMKAYDNKWVAAQEVEIDSDGKLAAIEGGTIPTVKITGSATALTLTIGEDVIYGQSDGNHLRNTADGNLGTWTVSEPSADMFKFYLVGSEEGEDSNKRYLAFSVYQNANKFRQYTEKNITDYPDSYVTEFIIYVYEGEDPNIKLDPDATQAEIVEAAYRAKEEGIVLYDEWSLTGVITSIQEKYSGQYKNITVLMEVEGKEIQCYRLTVNSGATDEEIAALEDLGIGDTVTVKGKLTYTDEYVRFAEGSILTNVTKSANPKQDITLDEDATAAEIIAAAYQAEQDGVDLLGTWELEGKITSIDTAYSGSYKNITVTMEVEGKKVQCYRLTVADKADTAALAALEALAVGDTIKVKGTMSYFYGTVQFAAGSVLVLENEEVQAPDTIDVISTGAGVVLVAGIAALAIIELKKRR